MGLNNKVGTSFRKIFNKINQKLAFVSVTIGKTQDILVLTISAYPDTELEPMIASQFQKKWRESERRGILKGLLYNKGVPTQDIPDLVNEIALQAMSSINNLSNWKDFDQWLIGIAKHTCSRYWRSYNKYKTVQKKSTEIAFHRQLAHSSPEVRTINKILLRDCMSDLSETEKTILFLRVIEDYTWEEIADTVGHPRSTVFNRYNNILAKLRTRIQ